MPTILINNKTSTKNGTFNCVRYSKLLPGGNRDIVFFSSRQVAEGFLGISGGDLLDLEYDGPDGENFSVVFDPINLSHISVC